MTDANTYSDHFFLCVRPNGRSGRALSFRITATQPRLQAGEVAIKVTLALPRALFQRPNLAATIAIPANKVSPTRIDAEVIQNIEELIRSNLGMDMKITLGE